MKAIIKDSFLVHGFNSGDALQNAIGLIYSAHKDLLANLETLSESGSTSVFVTFFDGMADKKIFFIVADLCGSFYKVEMAD